MRSPSTALSSVIASVPSVAFIALSPLRQWRCVRCVGWLYLDVDDRQHVLFEPLAAQ